MPPIDEHCLTPKQQTANVVNDEMQPCPPPPQATPEVFEMLVPTEKLEDVPMGFFLVAPCDRNTPLPPKVEFQSINHFKLQPKRLRQNDCMWAHPKAVSADWKGRAAPVISNKNFKGTHKRVGMYASSA